MRIGMGYDIHRFSDERKLTLCGIEIPYVKGLVSYTDGDVVLHAVADALLGAMGLGDIGLHFPNADIRYKGAPSKVIVEDVVRMLDGKKQAIVNLDIVIIAEEPKIGPFREKMTERLSEILGIPKERVNIKATTNEGVGSIGRGEAIASYAVVLLEEKR